MTTPPFDRIVHPTDLSQDGTPAFDHALRLAVAGRSHFYLVHAAHLAPGDDGDWDAFPGVRSTLRRWSMLPQDAAPEAVHERLGVRVTKAEVPDRDPIDAAIWWDVATYPGVVIPCRALAVVGVEQNQADSSGRICNDRVLALPAPRDERLPSLTGIECGIGVHGRARR